MNWKWFANRPVKHKISIVVGTFCVVLVIIYCLAVRDVMAGQARAEAIFNEEFVPTMHLVDARVAYFRSLNAVNDHVRATSSEGRDAAEKLLREQDA